jgi:sugar phosphate permease
MEGLDDDIRRVLAESILAYAALLVLIVGLTRIYLGVHFPTDVLAGWCAGIAWALLCSLVARWLQRKGAVEKETPLAKREIQSGGLHWAGNSVQHLMGSGRTRWRYPLLKITSTETLLPGKVAHGIPREAGRRRL